METFCKMIQYRKSLLDQFSIDLISRLDQDQFPLKSICNQIQKKRAFLIKVHCDEKVYGILIVRGIQLQKGELAMVIDHGIACDGLNESFSSILAESICQFVANEKFNGQYYKFIFQHAHTKALERLYSKYYGELAEYIFKKDVREFKNDRQTFIDRQASSVIID